MPVWEPPILVDLLTNHAHMPTRRDTGYDLRSAYNITISNNSRTKVKTDVKIHLIPYLMGRIIPCNDWCEWDEMFISADIVDSSTDNIYVIVCNRWNRPKEIRQGDRIGHLVFEISCQPPIINRNDDNAAAITAAFTTAINNTAVVINGYNNPDNTVCKICLSKPVNRVLIPCGHVICKECRPNIVACHICRQKILQDNSLYI